MHEPFLRYRIPGAQWQIEFPSDSLHVLTQHVQRNLKSAESAGQLYTRDINGPVVRIEKVTNPGSRWARYTGVRLDLTAIKKEREQLFRDGLHCLGFWHSHPEPKPHPSYADLALAAEQASAGSSEFAGLLFIIIGNAPFPEGLGVWVHDGVKAWRAEYIGDEVAR